MAVLRADGAFVNVSTVGAPPMGGSLPRCPTRFLCISNTLLDWYYTCLQYFCQQLFLFMGV